MQGHLIFTYDALNCAKPDHSEPDHAESNQGLHHPIIMWDLHSSGYYAAMNSNSVPMLRDNLSVQLQGLRNPKQRAQHNGR